MDAYKKEIFIEQESINEIDVPEEESISLINTVLEPLIAQFEVK